MLEKNVLNQILQEIEKNISEPIIIISGHNWHEGVIGIVAARIKEKLNKPVIIISIEKNIGKIVSIVQLHGMSEGKNEEIGNKIAMHIAASNPLAINKEQIDKKIVDKELEIIKAELENSGKPKEMIEKISKGKISKFLNDNSLLNQLWIMDPKKKVSDILKENSLGKELKVINFVKYKVGEGI